MNWLETQVYWNYLKTNFNCLDLDEQNFEINVKDVVIVIDRDCKKWSVKDLQFNGGRKTCFDLTKAENWSVLVLVLKLLNYGYKWDEIVLEKDFQVGHTNSYVDLAITKGSQIFALIEVKTFNQYQKIVNGDKNQAKQLLTYLQQDKSVQMVSYYSFDFEHEQDHFATIIMNEQLKVSANLDQLLASWNGKWSPIKIFDFNKFQIDFKVLEDQDLINLNPSAIKAVFHQFLTILRQYSVSDKARAFDKLINIFIAKIADERLAQSDYKVNGFKINRSLMFQWIENVDDNHSFLKRITNLYQLGMMWFLDQDCNDWQQDLLKQLIAKLDLEQQEQILRIFNDLSLKKDRGFDFIDINDQQSFDHNLTILKAIVQLLEKYRFKYANKFQYLGDFFEELLNTSWKQEAGQFFSPMPIVDFMVNSLPIKQWIMQRISDNENDILPKMIDNACGSGHFLISFMDRVQQIINEIDVITNNDLRQKIAGWKINPYSWTKDQVVGIEKDYRLAKTTKVATFLNGDGQATIIHGDGIDAFNAMAYQNSLLASQDHKVEKFDFLISNPPFAVAGFLKTMINKINDDDFKLLKTLKGSSGRIEILFVERMWQLLKVNGFGAIILPQAILSAKAYQAMRDFIFENFKILAICCFGDQTFSGTSTSPVILFLQKQIIKSKIDFEREVLIINSPKMIGQNTQAEKQFLGYEFSTNRFKLGIINLNDHLKTTYSAIVNQWIATGELKLNDPKVNQELVKVKKLKTMIVEQSDGQMMIYPNRLPNDKSGCQTLKQLGFKINQPVVLETISGLNYLEIGDLVDSQIKIKSLKNKKSATICKQGDLLFASLTPSKAKVAIADRNYYVSNAIYVISHQDQQMIKWLFAYLINDDKIFKAISGLVDGFKITYAKISKTNLMNQVGFIKN